MKNGMKTTIDTAGRLVIPKAARTAAGLEAGMELVVTVTHAGVEISPAPRGVSIATHGHLRVAHAMDDDEALTTATVDATRRELRERDRR